MDLFLILATITLAFPLFHFVSNIIAASKNNKKLPPAPKGWPVLGNLPDLGTKPHHTLHALSKKYGPLFRLRLGTVNVVVACSSSVAEQFLKVHDSNFSNRPPNSGAEHIAYNYQDMVFAPYGPRWRNLRRLCSLHLFSARALDDLRPVRSREISRLAGALYRSNNNTTPIELGRAVNVCATNALSVATVGRRVFDEEDEKASEFKEMVMELMKLAGVFNIGDFVPGLGWLDFQGVVKNMKKLHKKFDEFLDGLIAERREGKGLVEGGGADLLSVMLKLQNQNNKVDENDGGKLTDAEIKALLLNLFTAGTDTTSSTVEWAIAELLRHPDLLAAAQKELDTVVSRSRLVSETDLPNLPFLEAVIKETFRLHPSTPLSLPRMASEPCEINGYYIPKGATLLVNIWAIARDPAVWKDPLQFKPERFMPGGDHANVDVKGSNFEVIPFGAGRRICAGMSLGLRMVTILTATLVHGFEWALPDGQTPEKLDMEEAYGLTLQRAVPLAVRPIPRLAAEAYI